MLFESVAYAMGPAPSGGQSSGSDLFVQFVPLLLMFAIFWFLLIRPQQKRAKEHKLMLAALKKGDYVVTSGGMMGRILEIDAESILLKCGEASLRLSRSSISNTYEPMPQEIKIEKNSTKKSSKSADKNKSEKNNAVAAAPTDAKKDDTVEATPDATDAKNDDAVEAIAAPASAEENKSEPTSENKSDPK